MATNQGPNSLCRCGSGKKTKHCCGLKKGPVYWTKLNKILLVVLIIIGAGAAVSVLMSKDTTPTSSRPVPTTGNGSLAQPIRLDQPTSAGIQPLKSQPPGQAPPGKVWNAEHGHWHDDNSTVQTPPADISNRVSAGTLKRLDGPPTNQDAQIINPKPAAQTQPPGQAPEGQYWSNEHGHFHNIGDTGAHISSSPTSQPPGPPPKEGQFWSPEHGHWHSLPTGAELDAQSKKNDAKVISLPKDPN